MQEPPKGVKSPWRAAALPALACVVKFGSLQSACTDELLCNSNGISNQRLALFGHGKVR
jgi:hypothetical protein